MVRQIAKKIFTIFMVLTVLVSSHAFAYYEHICLITKQKTFSIEAKTCGGKFALQEESKTPEFKRVSCCELNIKVQKLDNGHQTHFNIPSFAVLEGNLQTISFTFLSPKTFQEKASVFIFTNSSPPKQKLFILHDQFLI